MRGAIQKENFSRIERRLSISFGMLIFFLLGIIFLSTTAYFNYLIDKEQSRLSSVIASSIGDSINRISFSGKYQTRLLVEELLKKNENIKSIIVQDENGVVIAHSANENNGAIFLDSHFEKAKSVIGSKNYLIQKIEQTVNNETVNLIEIDMPYNKGYEGGVFGVIRVFLSSDILSSFVKEGALYFSVLIIFLTLISIIILQKISNKVSAPIKNMALQLHGILEYAPLAIYISDEKGDIHSSSSLYSKIAASKIMQENIEAEKQVFKTGKVVSYDFTLNIDGRENYFHAAKCPIARDENQDVSLVCTIALDITERKEYENKIELLLEEQTAFFQNAVAGIVHFKDGIFIRSNEAWEKMLGYQPGELDNKSSRIIYPSEEEYSKIRKDAYESMLHAGHYTAEQTLQKKDGSHIVALLSGAYLDGEDAQKGSIWVGIDITDRKNAQDELLQINKTLQQTIDREIKIRFEAEQMALQQSKMALMGEMIGSIAHQWRQPLNSLGLSIQDIKEAYKYNELNEEYIDRTVSIAMDRINFMSKTIDDFRSFFSPTKSKNIFIIEDAIAGVINIISAQLQNHNITIEYSPTDKTEFFGYKSELQQALLNIISNAKDAIEESKSALKRISITIASIDDNTIINIEDTGGGIPPSIEHRIGEPYYSTKEQGKGTGIGLYMSKQIIGRHMDGELSFENGEYGAIFTIKLPKNSESMGKQR